MALGDYVKTTFVEGSAPGISAARLNNNEDKTAELDQALLTTQTDFNAHLADNVKHITSAERTAWNGKLDATLYTANDVLTKIKTVDGAGSGLDADTVDGIGLTGSGTTGLRKVTTSTSQPSGGSDGDLWFVYS